MCGSEGRTPKSYFESPEEIWGTNLALLCYVLVALFHLLAICCMCANREASRASEALSRIQ